MTDFGTKAGDMEKSTYDTDGDGVVDDSEKLESSSKAEVQDHTPKSHSHPQSDVTNLATTLAGKAATSHEHVETDITDLDHDAQKIKGVLIDDAAKADQKVLGYDSATERIVYITQAPSGAVLNSIQQGYIHIPIGSAYVEVAITAVDLTKTIVNLIGHTANIKDPEEWYSILELMNSTTLRATKQNTTAWGKTFYQVIEFLSGVNRVERSNHEIPGGSTYADKTITEVDLSKTLLFFNGGTNTDSMAKMITGLELVNATTLRFRREGTTGITTAHYSLVELS